jgi:hypothetical protein
MNERDLTGKGFKDYEAIAVGGDLFSIGVPVIRWDQGRGLDAYATNRAVVETEDRRTGKVKHRVIKGRRYGGRLMKGRRKPGKVTQIVIHHTGGFTAERAYETLHNRRKLSVQFIVADNGLVYQTLDALETAWHAGKANKCSVGIECCLYPDAERNPGAYSPKRQAKFGVAKHAEIEQELQGVEREVFAMPDDQITALTELCAGIWHALGHKRTPVFPPAGDSGDRDLVLRQVPLVYLPWAREHVGMVMHLHLSRRKWDAAGLDPEAFEEAVGDSWVDMLYKENPVPPGPSNLLEERP